ncbi:MAG: transposase [Bacteroidetes bacterium]|jgi:IS5 family transposase|nr:transposase [Bacteroidota bacterium]
MQKYKQLDLNDRHKIKALLEASNSPQVSRSTKRLQEIDEWIDWEPLDDIGRRIDKIGTYYFGYKGHIGVDAGSKLIRKIAFTLAAPHDSTVLEDLVSEDERSLFGDNAYGRDSLKQMAREDGWYYGILNKGNRGDPLSSAQKKRTKRHQQVRSQVEHPFASIKDRYGLRWARAKTKVRNKARFVMASICRNIERGITWSKKQQHITPARAT